MRDLGRSGSGRWASPSLARGEHPEKAHVARVLALAAAVLLIRAGERVGLTSLAAPPPHGQLQLLRLAAALAEDSEDEYGAPELRGILHQFPRDLRIGLPRRSRARRDGADQGRRPRRQGGHPAGARPRRRGLSLRRPGRIFESMGGSISHETLKAGDLKGALSRPARRAQGTGSKTSPGAPAGKYHLHHTDASATSALPVGFTARWEGALDRGDRLHRALASARASSRAGRLFPLPCAPARPDPARAPGCPRVLGFRAAGRRPTPQGGGVPFFPSPPGAALSSVPSAGPGLLPPERRARAPRPAASAPDPRPRRRRHPTPPARLGHPLGRGPARAGPPRSSGSRTFRQEGPRVPVRRSMVGAAGGPRTRGPWQVDAEAVRDWAGALEGAFETFWMSDGLDAPLASANVLAALRKAGGPVTVPSEKPPPR